jgi:hypothetical protein
MEKKKITIELDEWKLEQLRTIVNAFNRATDEKCDIDYGLVRSLDGADVIIGGYFGLAQPKTEHGQRSWWADYRWVDEEVSSDD